MIPTAALQSCMELSFSIEDLYWRREHVVVVPLKRWNEKGEEVETHKPFSIEVEPGWEDGQKMVLPKEGHQTAPSLDPEDMVFILRFPTHPLYTRMHDVLLYRAWIPIDLALQDSRIIRLKLPDGRYLDEQIDGIVTSKTRHVIEGEGLPLDKAGHRGDLILEFGVSLPQMFSERDLDLLRQAQTRIEWPDFVAQMSKSQQAHIDEALQSTLKVDVCS